jgi:hypothetical protein
MNSSQYHYSGKRYFAPQRPLHHKNIAVLFQLKGTSIISNRADIPLSAYGLFASVQSRRFTCAGEPVMNPLAVHTALCSTACRLATRRLNAAKQT